METCIPFSWTGEETEETSASHVVKAEELEKPKAEVKLTKSPHTGREVRVAADKEL